MSFDSPSIYDTFIDVNGDPPVPLSDEHKWSLLQRKNQRTKVARAVEFFRGHDIEPILIKGYAATLLYPKEQYRPSSDVDLAIPASDYDRACRIYENSKEPVPAVDLHREFRHLDTVDWNELYKNSRLVDLEGTRVRILSEEDHFRILCVHWLNDGGAYREKLWDIYYAVANRREGFDWDRCFGPVSEIRRRWIVCAIAAAHKYLELEIDDLPFADEARALPAWVERELEREWKSDVRIRGLETVLHDRGALIQQLRKRINPNRIQATIEVEGSMDARTRAFILLRDVLQRIRPSIRRIKGTLAPARPSNDDE